MYKIFVKCDYEPTRGVFVKEYPSMLQAIIWCYMNGYVYSGHGIKDFLDRKVKIIKE